MKDVINSHLISQVVLKQFANKNSDDKWQTLVHTKGSNDTGLHRIDEVASLEIDRLVIEALEQEWSNNIEKEVDKAINNLAKSNVNYVEKHIGIIKDLMALHLVRTTVFPLVDEYAKQIIGVQSSIKDQFISAYPEQTEAITKLYEEKVKTVIRDTAISIMKKEIPELKAHLADKSIGFEIGEAPEGVKFIIGDRPVIMTDKDGKINVPVSQASHIAMVLTPKYIVALKKSPDKKKYRLLEKQEVENVNKKQISIAFINYFSLP